MAVKETSAEKIIRLSKHREQIRNIATSAHIHHGKCISGDSRIILSNGRIKTAREIFEETAKEGKIYQDTEEHTIYTPKERLEVFSFNEGNIEKKPVQYVWRLKGGNTIKIKLRNGFNIETTPEHKYLISRNGLEYVEAKDIKLGDRIISARNTKTGNSKSIDQVKEEILKNLEKKNFYVIAEKSFSEKIRSLTKKHNIRNIKIGIKPNSFYLGSRKNRYNLVDLLKICKIFLISHYEVYEKIERIFFRTGKQNARNAYSASPMKLPKNEDELENLFYLAGLFIGDGSGKKFIAGKKQLADNVQKICAGFGIKTKYVDRGNRTPEVHTNNTTFVQILNSLFDYPLKKKSRNVRISEFVWTSDDEYISHLIRGYFDTDGCVEKSRRAVTISSASSQMIEDLHLLLLRFGCISIKEKDNTISISGSSALNFEKNIGFSHDEKIQKLKTLVSKVSGSIVCDTVRSGNKLMLINKRIEDVADMDIAHVEVKSIESGYEDVVYDFTVPETHNFISEGIVIHNTAMTDTLLAAAGMMSQKAAGNLEEGMATWQHADEQERLMTVDAANVSMVHEFDKKEYLINLIDTPGHVDFSGNVTRAMRAIDGTIVLVCAVEGIMPQTETVLRQALRERVKPVLFINKVDRLIKELKLTPEQMQERFIKIYEHFNSLVEKIAEPEFREKWKVSITDGSVAFGSARDNWALSLPFMKKKGIGFKDIIKITTLEPEERKKWVWANAPLPEVLLDIVIKHLPNPLEAQKYRIPKIWRGDIDSQFGKDLLNCNPHGKPAFVITRIVIDPRSQKEISAGRLFSGTLQIGQDVYLNMAKKKQKVQQLFIYNGVKPEQIESIQCGNVLAISGVYSDAGETVTLEEETPFEELKHIFEPVITKAIEVTRSADLPKLIDILRKVGKEDPSIKIQINEETGENLISGMGELHLEIIENRIKTEKGLEVKTSSPIVVYRETITKASGIADGKSPNKHNLFFIKVEPLEEEIYKAIQDGSLPEGRVKKNEKQLIKTLVNLGISNDEAKQYRDVYKSNIFLDKTKGEVHIGEVIELVLDAFEQVMDAGPLAREPCTKLKISLEDIKLHEDAIHRGPAQVYPAVRDAIYSSMEEAGRRLLEPVQIHEIDSPVEMMPEITKLVVSKRGQIIDVKQENDACAVVGKMPVAEMLGWSSDLRSATEGRGVSALKDQMFELMPLELQANVIRNIRSRKGLAENQ